MMTEAIMFLAGMMGAVGLALIVYSLSQIGAKK